MTRLRLHDGLLERGLPGQIDGFIGADCQVLPVVNNSASARETWTIAPPGTVDNSTTYRVTVDDLTISFTTDATATGPELVNGLNTAWRANVRANAMMTSSVAGGNLVLTAKRDGDTFNVSVNAGETTNDLVATRTVPASDGRIIPFGVFVSRPSAWAHNCGQIPLVNTETILGITSINRKVERTGIGENAIEGYRADKVMDVVSRTGANKAIFARCVESDLSVNDGVYIAVGSGGTGGHVTRSSSGTIDARSIVRVKEPAFYSKIAGCWVVPVSVQIL